MLKHNRFPLDQSVPVGTWVILILSTALLKSKGKRIWVFAKHLISFKVVFPTMKKIQNICFILLRRGEFAVLTAL